MPPEDIFIHSQLLLTKVSVITGWKLPKDQSILTILTDQFAKKLIEDYPLLNFDEMEYAIRSKSTIVNNWGQDVNLSLIDKVLIPYSIERSDLSRGEAHRNPQLPPSQVPEMSCLEILEHGFEMWKDSKSKKIAFINPKCYDILEMDREITLTGIEKEDIKRQVVAIISSDIDTIKYLHDDIYISNMCKKLAVALYWNKKLTI